MHYSYLKMALQMLRSNPFFSLLSIIAIAVTIMIVLVISMQHELVLGAKAPEVNLSRTVVMRTVRMQLDNKSRYGSKMGNELVSQMRENLRKPVAISQIAALDWNLVNPAGITPCKLVYTDWEFWNIHRFDFLSGRPFTRQETEAGTPVMVISASIAERHFQGNDPLGATLEIMGQPFQVTGVVKDVSSLRRYASGDIWIPFTHNTSRQDHPFLGPFELLLMGEAADEVDAMKQEVKELVKGLARALPDGVELQVIGPDTPMEQYFRGGSLAEELGFSATWMQIIWRMLAIMSIPALNLIAINYTWIGERAGEIGLRKAFGASRFTLVRQLLLENTLITAVGGILGLLLFYLIAKIYSDLLFRTPFGEANFVKVELSLLTLLVATGSILFLSIISGLLPAIKISNTQPASVLKGGAS